MVFPDTFENYMLLYYMVYRRTCKRATLIVTKEQPCSPRHTKSGEEVLGTPKGLTFLRKSSLGVGFPRILTRCDWMFAVTFDQMILSNEKMAPGCLGEFTGMKF